MSHTSISAYILESALHKAEADIYETERIQLSSAERESFFAALINPPEPNESMKVLFSSTSTVVQE